MNAPAWLWYLTASAVTFAFAMFVILIYRSVNERNREAAGWEMHVTPYVKKPALLTPEEQVLYVRLIQAAGSEFAVCPKVRLADAIEVRADTLELRSAWNWIAAKRIRFLLVQPDTYQPLLAVELNQPGDRHRLDEKLERALVDAGLPVLRLKPRSDYDPLELKQQIDLQVYRIPR